MDAHIKKARTSRRMHWKAARPSHAVVRYSRVPLLHRGWSSGSRHVCMGRHTTQNKSPCSTHINAISQGGGGDGGAGISNVVIAFGESFPSRDEYKRFITTVAILPLFERIPQHCSKRKVRCRVGCGSEVEAGRLEHHERELCTQACRWEGCEERLGPLVRRQLHERFLCSHRSVECPHGCGIRSLSAHEHFLL